MALAAALHVPPVTLLMPHTQEWDKSVVPATGVTESVTPQRLWLWLTAKQQLGDRNGVEDVMWLIRATPPGSFTVSLHESEVSDGDD